MKEDLIMVGSKRSRPGDGVSSGSSLVRLGRLTTSKTDSSLVRCRSFVSKYPLIRCVSVELDSDDEEDATTLNHLNPWKQRHVEQQTNDLVYRYTHYHNPKHTFQKQESNLDLDIDTKRHVLKLSPSIAVVTSYQGGNQVFWGSGVIFECFWENDSFCCSVLMMDRVTTTANQNVKDPFSIDCVKVMNSLRDDLRFKSVKQAASTNF